jgi:hypothetical protein
VPKYTHQSFVPKIYPEIQWVENRLKGLSLRCFEQS